MTHTDTKKYQAEQIEEAKALRKKREERKLKCAQEKELRMLQLLEDVKSGTGYSTDLILSRYFSVPRQRIWVWSREGKLPQPYKIGENTTRWKNDEVRKAEEENFLGEAL
ncbi:MAG: helix-turn-helix transcriptional regulator [Pseudohongiellaceae bacterium]|tara:strand:- start:1354 stop:1683 length:330 start_codon:yes stop_codon:yes gene_type:complete